MKLIIAGSRDFSNYEYLEKKVLEFLKAHRKSSELVEIVSGKCRGADRLGEGFADRYGLNVISMPADWDKFGKRAGYMRNSEMAKVASHCIIFWDGVSPGSKHMFETATEKNLKTEVCQYDKEN